MSKKRKPKQGGKREGAGRKLKFNEQTATVSVRCPVSKAEELKALIAAKLAQWLSLS